MKASELVQKLIQLTAEHGDLEVYTFPTGELAEPTIKVEQPGQWHTRFMSAADKDRKVITLG